MMTTVAVAPALFVPTHRAGGKECKKVWSSGRSELKAGAVSTWSRWTRGSSNGRSVPLVFRQPAHSLSRSRHTASGIAVQLAEKMADNADGVVRTKIHYYRKSGKYEKWGLHVWGGVEKATEWDSPLVPTGEDEYGVYWEVDAVANGQLRFVVHKGDAKDCEASISSQMDSEIWLVSGRPTVFTEMPDPRSLPQGDLGKSRAFWVAKDLLAWNAKSDSSQIYLHSSDTAQLEITAKGVEGSDIAIKLEEDLSGLPQKVLNRFPYITGYRALRLPANGDARKLLKSQLALSATDENGQATDATGIQIAGVLDDLFAYDGPLGANATKDGVKFDIWAPTAQNVRLFLFSTPTGGEPVEKLQLQENKGVWSGVGPSFWKGKYYLYEVTVYHPATQQIEISLANDPYSRGLSVNGDRSLIIDMADAHLAPEGWAHLAYEKPDLDSFNDISIYELHIRDFSISDKTVDPAVAGGYLAFAQKDSAGVAHLKKLAEAGLTHIHLLPCFDFSSVDERKETWKSVDEEKLSKCAPDSEEQQKAVVAIQDQDGFNWGYDPVYWGVPEGSYATDPNGPTRTVEFRTMVQAINKMGLRVVLDVVYNHLHGSGPVGHHSCLDKVVPRYYLRLNQDGFIENSTCMNNTASEYYMVDRLIVDDLKHWAVNYKVDGFRFDLMGHLTKHTMLRAKEVLRSLTLEKDGVDGSKIYIYGEGWDFGEVANNARGVNACQQNLAGTGIGSFNDRIRDTCLGGSPFGDPLQQGLLTGLALQPNALFQGGDDAMHNALAATTDWVKLGLAANLKDFSFVSYKGDEVKGAEVLTHDGKPVAYASSPEELVNYVSAHDNETLFDVVMMKSADGVTLEERCRINHLATCLVALAQGIPFFHAGDELLRSKSLDRDSYNSGDWFNRLDFTYETNNWGVGLPPQGKNGEKWPLMRSLLSDPSLKPSKKHILAALANFQEFLRIRFSSPLFRLRNANAIQARLKFHNTGPESIPAVIVFTLSDGDEGIRGLTQIDPNFRRIAVVINARPLKLGLEVDALKNVPLTLHPVQEASADEVVRQSKFDSHSAFFEVPPRTAAVFVEKR
ncbi:hypothetical protein M758_1G172900 [Ceratodon purpureus]|nr:hypothetical protein M758_1G172900 [Ceratodon purpureus]